MKIHCLFAFKTKYNDLQYFKLDPLKYPYFRQAPIVLLYLKHLTFKSNSDCLCLPLSLYS